MKFTTNKGWMVRRLSVVLSSRQNERKMGVKAVCSAWQCQDGILVHRLWNLQIRRFSAMLTLDL